jgi:hypothetical protein
MWSTTSKAFWLSTVTKYRGSIVTYFASALVSQIREPAISIDICIKKGKNPMNMDNYRGIAVTPVISKLFEYAILPTLAENFTQSTLQFGF